MVKQIILRALVAIVAIGFASLVSAQVDVKSKEFTNSLGQKLKLRIDAVADSPIPGLVQLYTDRGLFYASDDGKHFLQARVYNVENSIVDVTENALKDMRMSGMGKFEDSAIVFKAKNEKHVINVFTDATCGYCRKLHNEMDQLNDLGITVRYLAFPRAGVGSSVYNDAVSIWCSKDPQDAITRAKAGETVASAKCENQVAEQYNFGKQIGVNGTPNIVFPDGSVVPGYQPAKTLAEALAQMAG
ncbi:bifunctional protein-disulfide isomerase/oxidoreductase DsbC [Agaribacter marinus]|uniref:Thiol:disulfide interchange protein n=1 Tax=Agaribacter marinus TaxID=1431249 RepID=A0AA37T2D0_9ALTE|nr:bifunctional protein-disulfide isomerase/oxidoreductase DsbC [Agaribacter marinus]GLR72705.1 thiol:disulfide interchange protein DsbC [Agaribacter marinus]